MIDKTKSKPDEHPPVEITIRAVEGRLWATPSQLTFIAHALEEINSNWVRDKFRQATRRTVTISKDGEEIVYSVKEEYGSSAHTYDLRHK